MKKSVILLSFFLILSVFTGSAFAGSGSVCEGTRTNCGGDYNVFVGQEAGNADNGGSENTFIGAYAGRWNTTGNYNNFIGYAAGYSNTTASYNTFSGYRAGFKNTTGAENVFFGYNAGYFNTEGIRNTFIGYQTGLANTTGSYNTFFGYQTGYVNTTGIHNTFFGYGNGVKNTSGSYNTFLGNYAGFSNTAGYYNTAIGYGAGLNNTGTGNVFIGYAAGYNETGSNKLYIDNSITATPLIYGDFSTNTLNINGTLTVNGAVVQTSSREYKSNIKGLNAEDAMETLRGLNPVTFNYKESPEENQVGFIAEDVPELVATKDHKGLSSMDVVAVLTKVVQEQQKSISALSEKVSDLERLLIMSRAMSKVD